MCRELLEEKNAIIKSMEFRPEWVLAWAPHSTDGGVGKEAATVTRWPGLTTSLCICFEWKEGTKVNAVAVRIWRVAGENSPPA